MEKIPRDIDTVANILNLNAATTSHTLQTVCNSEDGKAVAFGDLSDEQLLKSCLTHEQIVEWQFSSRSAECWKHFNITLIDDAGVISYQLDCRFKNAKHARKMIKRSKLAQGSSNLNSDVKNKAVKRKTRKVKIANGDDTVEEVIVDGPSAEQEEDAEMQRLLDDDAAERAALSSDASADSEARDAHDDAVVSKTRQLAVKYMAEKEFVRVSASEAKAALQLLPRVTGLAKKTHDSNTVAAAFAQIVADDNTLTSDIRVLATRCQSRWNTDYDSLDSFLKLKGPVAKLLQSPDFNLKVYRLSSDQWPLAQDLHDVLDCFKDVTLKMSQGGDKRPLACDVIPEIEQLKTDLLAASKMVELADVCRVAAYGGVLILDKYLPLLAKCEAYVFAIYSSGNCDHAGPELRLLLLLSADGFNPNSTAKQTKSSKGYWIAVLNLPPDERFKLQNLFFLGSHPHPTPSVDAEGPSILAVICKELATVYDPGMFFTRTHKYPPGSH
ncbi:Dimer-Tnp-hAT domain-containing protein [Mycena chlorophos]|uniref:Dimer-Tnp-hAT domain-containing protein n=1 Tax=Mycena chlorophos TaxID=658473 RepID=A0A8H6TI98_MYCCL|nr:Dimer-Tnp-hAT domain-containing protein [Mycena chlorophos]